VDPKHFGNFRRAPALNPAVPAIFLIGLVQRDPGRHVPLMLVWEIMIYEIDKSGREKPTRLQTSTLKTESWSELQLQEYLFNQAVDAFAELTDLVEIGKYSADETEWEVTWSADMPKPMLLGSVIR
jgi:hypothetical protein